MNRIENLKADNFRYFSNYEWLSNWEDFLTSDYWKSWQTKIPVFQNEKELIFYTQRLGEIASLISRCRKYGTREEENADLLLIKQEETRLQNISHEDWKKEYKFSDVELKEMGVEEIEKEFGKDIDAFFGLEYKSWTKDQLISEINRLKAENEELKNNQTLTTSERQERLQKNQQKLEKLEKENSIYLPPNNSNDGFPTGLLIGGAVLAVIGLILFLVIKSTKRIKKRS